MIKQRIFLVGLMGSGKSYWGEKLAALLQWKFIDLDRFIEEKEKLTIPEIFKKKGENHFRDLESKYLGELATMQRVVVAAGGGTPCFHDNMKRMNELGVTFYLKANMETIAERLKDEINTRPLLKGKTKEELPAFFTKQLKKRDSFYCLATHTVVTEKLSEENLEESFFLKLKT